MNFLPEIILDDDDYEYSCAFLDLIIKAKSNDDLKKIVNLDVLRVNSDLVSDNSYINGERSHTIHQFATSASRTKGQILAEIPSNLNYFPIKSKRMTSAQISIVDPNNTNLNDWISHIYCRININRNRRY